MEKRINIALDGYSSCGKSTLAKALANHLNYIYIDSGAMYRSVALYAIRHNIADNKTAIEAALPEIEICFKLNSQNKSETYLNGENVEDEIRDIAVSSIVSQISQIHSVRIKLVELQQKMSQSKGVVMDGRDIGSVVLPNAELKIFMTASQQVRAQRRFQELKAKGKNITLKEVENNLKMRDFEDENRSESPLIKTQDAKVLDNSDINEKEQFDLVLSWVDELLGVC